MTKFYSLATWLAMLLYTYIFESKSLIECLSCNGKQANKYTKVNT